MMHDCGVEKNKFQKNTYVKKHLCIILQMAFNILFQIAKAKDHKKDLLSISYKFFVTRISSLAT
jgi:hypothetical protein